MATISWEPPGVSVAMSLSLAHGDLRAWVRPGGVLVASRPAALVHLHRKHHCTVLARAQAPFALLHHWCVMD